jgi:SOS-response transcriptional repressor LexA
MAAVVSIASRRRGHWSLLEIARPGQGPVPYGILLAGADSDDWAMRLRDADFFLKDGFGELDETEVDVLTELGSDLQLKARQMGGVQLLDSLEDSVSHFVRVSDRAPIAYSHAAAAVDSLFDEHVGGEIRRYITHIPLYDLRAAATRFGEGMDAREESWVRAPENLRLSSGMFAAHVVGRSMQPLIPDGSVCIFRAPVTGSRRGRNLLIEKFDETDFAARYTVKRYARAGRLVESADREAPIRLEPLNPDFEAFDLTSDQFRVVAEFVQVLYS